MGVPPFKETPISTIKIRPTKTCFFKKSHQNPPPVAPQPPDFAFRRPAGDFKNNPRGVGPPKTFVKKHKDLENIVYHFFRHLWLVLGVKLMELNSNLFSRDLFKVMAKIENEFTYVQVKILGKKSGSTFSATSYKFV